MVELEGSCDEGGTTQHAVVREGLPEEEMRKQAWGKEIQAEGTAGAKALG